MTTATPATPQRSKPRSPSDDWDDVIMFDRFDSEAERPTMSSMLPAHETSTKARRDHGDKVESHAMRTPQRNVADGLRAWSESPTSPRQRATPGPKRTIGRPEERENWDDDFLDSSDSPSKLSTSTPIGQHSRSIVQRGARAAYEDPEEENWDEDFEMGINSSSPGAGPSNRSKRSRRVQRERDPTWDSSDDEMEDFDREMGFDRNDEEDKTLTARSRRKPLSSLSNDVVPLPPLPSLPPLPTFLPTIPSGDVPGPYASPPSPFPRSSPSHSVFSIPATTTSAGQRDRDSTYGSTAHLALSLRRTHSAESSPSSPLQQKFINPNRFPQGSETPRERRRLRKKSRPPHLEPGILELDDRAVAEPPFHRPPTPDSRPCTPPPSSSPGVVLLPQTPSSSAKAVENPPVPTSPTSAAKSPLLARIGSMRRWGRKRSNTTTGTESTAATTAQPSTRSPVDGAPPSSFSTRILDAEADRFDNNRTPRPKSHATSPQTAPSLSTMPVLQQPPESVNRNGPPQTPSRNRFFRGSSGGVVDPSVNANAPSCGGGRPSLSVERPSISREKSRERTRERERLRVAIPQSVPMAMAPQSSQSGDSESGGVTVSPRRARIRAFGQRLLSPKRSTSASSERGKESSDGSSSQQHHPTQELGAREIGTPLSGETPTRLRPRLSSSRPSRGKARQVVPRSVSGSAVKERSHSPLAPIAPSMSASGRSVSASGSTETAPSSEDLTHSDKGSDEKAGHRGFMGSLRRISLASAYAQHQRHQQQPQGSEDHSRAQSPVPAVPPLPRSPVEQSPTSTSNRPTTSSGATKDASPRLRSPVVEVGNVDLASPSSSGVTHDWLPTAIGPPRRSGEMPILSHSKSSSFATASSSQSQSQSQSGSAGARLSMASQVASLGRASPLPIASGSSGNLHANGSANNVPRRSSLGDLKIPSRISRAQDGLKRDLGRVREFATRVEQMQDLRTSYFAIATHIQSILDSPRPPSRATSPTGSLFGLSRSNSKTRSATNLPPAPVIDYRGLALGFQAIDAKYSIAWECADLLIELGTGSTPDSSSRPVPVAAAVAVDAESGATTGKNRERAITLSGDEGKPDLSQSEITSPNSLQSGSGSPPPALVSWRATAGRQDLGHRQLYLLKEMLNNAESMKEGSQLDIPDVPTWAEASEAMESTFTLPTDESAATDTNPPPGSPMKKKRTSRLVGIRDMLRSLKRSAGRAVQGHPEGIVMQSSTTLSTESSFEANANGNARQPDNHPYSYNTVSGPPSHPAYGRRKSETSAALMESMRSSNHDYNAFTGKLLTHKASPRRPSLASLFRIGQKHKGGTPPSQESPNRSVERTDPILDISGVAGTEAANNNPDSSQDAINDDLEDSDWDRLDSMSDVDAAIAAAIEQREQPSARGSTTMKLRKKKQQNRLSMPPINLNLNFKNHVLSYNSSQGSFATPDQSVTNINGNNVRSPRLSNVDENDVSMSSTASGPGGMIGMISGSGRQTPESTRRPRSRAGKDKERTSEKRDKHFSSVRTAPPKPSSKGIPSFDAPPPPQPGQAGQQSAVGLKLAMTPENIKPLLENARVVTSRLHDCIAEVKGLILRTEGAAFVISSSQPQSSMAL